MSNFTAPSTMPWKNGRALADVYLDFLLEKEVAVFALAGGLFSQRAGAAGLVVYEEFFADRGYQVDGSLIPRGQPGAVVSNPDAVLQRMERRQEAGGNQTICVHSDSPGAVAMLSTLNNRLA